MLVAGFDPGGANAFGWAVLSGTCAEPTLIAGGVVTGARNAVAQASLHLLHAPAAVGIDAPLFWSPNGDRRADAYVRTCVCAAGGRGGTVGHVNSLKGACLVEGAIAARAAQTAWPAARVTEAHPKALVLVSPAARAFAGRAELQGEGHHLRDAALGAFTALAMLEGAAGWQDLAAQEPDPLWPLAVEAAYWFPRI
jgi:hypothetical protein